MNLADYTDVYVGVVFVGVHPATRAEFADTPRLVDAVSEVLQRTLRRCDLPSRLGSGELTVMLVSDGLLNVHRAVGRLVDALATCPAGAQAKIGYAGYDSKHPVTLRRLLQQARYASHAVAC